MTALSRLADRFERAHQTNTGVVVLGGVIERERDVIVAALREVEARRDYDAAERSAAPYRDLIPLHYAKRGTADATDAALARVEGEK